MKVGFIGLGRMGGAMARRLLDGKHDVGAYNRSAEKLKPLTERGAKPLVSIAAAANYGAAVFTMLADDAAVLEVAGRGRRASRRAAARRHSYLRRHPQRCGHCAA